MELGGEGGGGRAQFVRRGGRGLLQDVGGAGGGGGEFERGVTLGAGNGCGSRNGAEGIVERRGVGGPRRAHEGLEAGQRGARREGDKS